MTKFRKSRFCFLVDREGDHLAYCSSTNSFYKINEAVSNYIANFESLTKPENVILFKQLRQLRLITTEEEDDSMVNVLKMNFLTKSFSKETIGVTFAPTLQCNLCCPYCFELKKDSNIMNLATCDHVLDFIKGHKLARYLQLTWYGGEPLIGAAVIKHFLSRLDELEEIKMVRHGLVTNATLLSGDHLELFREHPLSHIQVTLDGMENTHDKRRMRNDKSGTFRTILDNLKTFVSVYPLTNVAVRVNVDRYNYKEFMPIWRMIREMFPEKTNIFTYPGILHKCGKQDNHSPFLENEEISFIKEQFAEEGYPLAYPNIVDTGCYATSLMGYIIGPQGEIYKCWEDVGCADRVVGNVVDKKYTNMSLMADYMLHGSHILEKECNKCPLLPICSNDCARHRLENNEHDAGYNLCSLYKNNQYENLKDVLYNFYKRYVECKQTVDDCCH